MIYNWLLPSVFALLSFGFWGFFSKIALHHIDAKSALVFQTLGVLAIGIITLRLIHFKPATDLRGITFAVLTGLAYGIGCLFYLLAADKGKVSTVVTMTALYPVITIALSYVLLQEQITMKQYIGIGFALTAIYLMAS